MPGLGHFGFGFGVKRLVPGVPLWLLLITSDLLDFLSMIFEYTGTNQGWSHGLLPSLLWTGLAVSLAGLISRDPKVAGVFGFLVFSHWLLDFIAWPMTYLFPESTGLPLILVGSPEVGLGVSSTLVGTLLMEFVPIAIGLGLYIPFFRKTRTERQRNTISP